MEGKGNRHDLPVREVAGLAAGSLARSQCLQNDQKLPSFRAIFDLTAQIRRACGHYPNELIRGRGKGPQT